MRKAHWFAVALSAVLSASAISSASAADLSLPKHVAVVVGQVDEEALELVELLVIGAEPESVGVTPQQVLAFFDQAVAQGKLSGDPPVLGLLTMRFILQSAVVAYEDDELGGTFFWLSVAFLCSDGFDRPVKDIVYGPASGQLNSMIFDALVSLFIPGEAAVPTPAAATVAGESLSASPAAAQKLAR
jgi:hypothetical protein